MKKFLLLISYILNGYAAEYEPYVNFGLNSELAKKIDKWKMKGQLLLLKSAKKGASWAVRELINNGVDVNSKIHKEDISILNKAIQSGYPAMAIETLLENGASLKTKDGNHPLVFEFKEAIKENIPYLETIRTLLKAGSNPNYVNSAGESIPVLLESFKQDIEAQQSDYMVSKLSFVRRVTKLLDTYRNRKKIVRYKVVEILTNPKFEKNGVHFTPLPLELAIPIAEKAYPYRD